MNDIIRIDRVVAEFDVWLGEMFPFAKMKVKVLDRKNEGLLAIPNLHVLNKLSREPEYMCGLGDTVEEAVEDALARFTGLARQHMPETGLTIADFSWSAPEDF
jgi:hypothetical protein